MTAEKAIEHLENIAIFSFQDGYTDEARKALDMAIEALEKQIPKIVRIEHEHPKYGHLKYGHVSFCPNCKHMDVGDVEKWHYCPLCGQALKMEGET